jgi:Tfp pilus assembly protein PilN
MTKKYDINLLQPQVLPKVPLLSLNRVVAIWGVLLVILSLVTAVGYYQLTTTVKENQLLAFEKSQKLAKQDELTARVSINRIAPELKAELETLQILIKNKKVLYTSLTDTSQTYVSGFAKAMTELANIHHRDISLENISINHNNISFAGLARTPNAVPVWMSSFKQADWLRGKYFKHFKLAENKQHYTAFYVSSEQPAQELF